MAASSDEIRACGCVGWVVDWIGYGAGYVAEIARVPISFSSFPPLFDDPEESEGSQCAENDAWEEAGYKGFAIKATSCLDEWWGFGLRCRRSFRGR